jgi:hypothetical protein
MGNRFRISWTVLAALALTLLVTGGATAQTQSVKTDVLMFEVIAVDGNNVVVRDQNGTRALTVPEDFKFTVDGKPMSVHDLTPGMKGSATVTTTITSRPVYVTEVKKGVVVDQVGNSVRVRTEEGVRRFTQGEIDKRGVQILIDGKPVRVTQLRKGDQLTATIITSGPPEVLTEKEVQATLDAPPAAAAPAMAAPAETPAATPAATETPPAAAMTETPPAETMSEAPAAEAPAAASDEPVVITGEETAKPDRRWIWILLVVIVVVGFLLMRRRRAQQHPQQH